MSKKLLVGALSLLTLAGCGTAPTTPQATTTNTASDRHVTATTDNMQQIINQLPAKISNADAQRMLVTIDPSQIKNEPTRHVNVVLRRSIGLGVGYHGFSHWGWGGGYRSYGLYNRFRYLNYGGYGFPYYNYGAYWYPYTAAYYRPYLLYANNYCYPYSYYW